ncbi:2-C-methyl-D-erythritol 4-phosphate cytidylyltransferase [Aurantivibrio infirmus]
MNKSQRVWAIVPAAGIGSRMKADKPKQYLEIDNKTVLEHTLSRLLLVPSLEKIFVALQADDVIWPSLDISRHPKIESVAGGESRHQSVANCLKQCQGQASSNDWILVHDAARPCVSGLKIKELLKRIKDHPVGGILASPASDTLKRINADFEIIETVDRSSLYRAHTPQIFRYQILVDAFVNLQHKKITPTDEAMAVEADGKKPFVLEDSKTNIKITESEDLYLAQLIMAMQRQVH